MKEPWLLTFLIALIIFKYSWQLISCKSMLVERKFPFQRTLLQFCTGHQFLIYIICNIVRVFLEWNSIYREAFRYPHDINKSDANNINLFGYDHRNLYDNWICRVFDTQPLSLFHWICILQLILTVDIIIRGWLKEWVQGIPWRRVTCRRNRFDRESVIAVDEGVQVFASF